MVRIHPDPPISGAVAQLGERLLCKQEAVGSIPSSSTNAAPRARPTRRGGPLRKLSRDHNPVSPCGGVGFWLLGPNRLLFNNPEEVKRILPRDNEEGGRRLAWRSVLSSLLEVRLGLIVSTRLFLVGRGELRKHLMTIEH